LSNGIRDRVISESATGEIGSSMGVHEMLRDEHCLGVLKLGENPFAREQKARR
jgi:hypothetical protein